MANKIRHERHCSVCQTRYSYCGYCDDYKHLEPWHDAYCSADCHDLYNIIAGYLNGWKTPEEEAARLRKITIPDRSKLSEEMNTAINALLSINGKPDVKVVEPVQLDKTNTHAESESKPEAKEEQKDDVLSGILAETKTEYRNDHKKIKYEEKRNKNMNAAAADGEKMLKEYNNFHGKPMQTKFKKEETK